MAHDTAYDIVSRATDADASGSRRERRLAAVRSRPRQVRFEELRGLLDAFGFEGRHGKGDHWVFRHPLLRYVVTVDPRRPHVLPVYVRNALKAIEETLQKEVGGA